MTTILSPPQTESPPETQTEVRLLACQGLIRGAVKRCAHPDGGYRGLDLEDLVQEATIEVWRELRDYTPTPRSGISGRSPIVLPSTPCAGADPWTGPYITRGKATYHVISLEVLAGTYEGLALIEEALAGHRRRWELPDPPGRWLWPG